MPKTALKLSPTDHGRRMRLVDFDHAEGQEGYIYELSRGLVIVSDVPKRRHLAQVHAIRSQVYVYDAAFPGRIHTIATGGECKLLLRDWESERHPDLAIYLKAPVQEEDLWTIWIPDVAIEVVSRGSEERDYVLKREEYWEFGVREYWIVNAQRQEILVLQRGPDDWTDRVIRRGKNYRCPLLPGFVLKTEPIFAAAGTRE